jgi:hypothetical protein
MNKKVVEKVVDKAMDLGNYLRENVFGTQVGMGALSENPKVKVRLENKNKNTFNKETGMLERKAKTRDEGKRIEKTKKFANGGKVDFKGIF